LSFHSAASSTAPPRRGSPASTSAGERTFAMASVSALAVGSSPAVRASMNAGSTLAVGPLAPWPRRRKWLLRHGLGECGDVARAERFAQRAVPRRVPGFRIWDRRVLENDGADEIGSVACGNERGKRAERVPDQHGRRLRDLTQDAERVVGERAERVLGGAAALSVTAGVVSDRPVARREAREDVLPVLRPRQALMQQQDHGLPGDATGRVVVRELRIALQRPRARKSLRHRRAV